MSKRQSPTSPSSLPLLAFTAVVDRHQNALHTFLLHLVGDVEQAYDLLQDTFHDAWRAAREGTAPFVAERDDDERRRWLFGVAYHKGLAVLRRRRLIHWESLDFLISFAGEPSLVTTSFEDQLAEGEALRAALARLSPQNRACFLLCAAHGLSTAEAGQVVKASPEAVRKRLSRAKQQLRRMRLPRSLPYEQQSPHPTASTNDPLSHRCGATAAAGCARHRRRCCRRGSRPSGQLRVLPGAARRLSSA